jgi:ribosomal protein S18 acetylase RimI-like enzyme
VDDLARRAHLNLLEFSRESTRWGIGGRLEERDGVLLYATGTWVPVLNNGAFRLDASVAATDVIARAEDFFRELRRGYTIMVRDTGEDDDLVEASTAAGLTAFDQSPPEMVCRERLADAPAPDRVELRVVSTPEEVADFAAVNSNAYATYGMPTDALPAVFSRPEGLLAAENVVSVVAYADGEAVGAAQTLVSHGIAGVYWVGTVDGARGRGIGEAVTRAVTNAGFDMGASANTLQASVMGEPIYARMGYETLYRYRAYIRWGV